MQWDEHPDQELLVFCLEGKCKAIDDAPQNLKQLSNPVEVLRLVNKPWKQIKEVSIRGAFKTNFR